MPTKPKLRFSIATLLWVMVCVAVFFGGRWSRESEIKSEQTARDKSQTRAVNAEEKLAALRRAGDVLTEMIRGLAVAVDVPAGDTVFIVENRKLARVRLVGIGCPDLDQPFGNKAKQFTADFCMKKHVELIGTTTDSQGFRLADAVIKGESLCEALLSAGLAWHDTRTNNDPELAKLQAEAKAAKRGLWADDDPVPPWKWREWLSLTERHRATVNLHEESIDKTGSRK